MKITELKPVPKRKVGKVILNGTALEPHEKDTMLFLAQYGFDIEVIRPTNTPKTTNPDILMLGTIWEMKAPTTKNEDTIIKRFRKASGQAGRIVFDLRKTSGKSSDTQDLIIKLFKKSGRARRLIIITKTGKVLDFIK